MVRRKGTGNEQHFYSIWGGKSQVKKRPEARLYLLLGEVDEFVFKFKINATNDLPVGLGRSKLEL